MRDRLLALPSERVHLGAMLCLTFVTGIVDAVGYLGLDRVFTGNMTGNVVILGMGLVGADELPVLGPSLALAGFLTGAAVAGRTLRSRSDGWSARVTALFVVVGVVLLALGVLLLARGGEPDRLVALVVSTTLGVVMGLQAATARFLGVKDVTTVVVTSTITGLAADSVLGSGAGAGSVRRLTAVLCIFLGALAGASLLLIHLGIALLVAGALAVASTLLGGLHHRLRRPDRGAQSVDRLVASGS